MNCAAGVCKSLFLFFVVLPLVAVGQTVVINEIHYEPPDKTIPEEFIELCNPTDTAVDLSDWRFSAGVSYVFPEGTILMPRAYLVVAEDPEVFANRFGNSIPVFGPYLGQLDNDGERVVLLDAHGNVVDQVDYQLGFPWPLATAGDGPSLELINPSLENDLGGSWRPAGTIGSGNPTRQYFIPASASSWHFRKGTSNPPADWRQVDFVEDGTWYAGRAPFGYGDDDDNTVLSDMRDSYSTIYLRRTFTIPGDEDIPELLKLGVYSDDGAAVWINDQLAGLFHVDSDTLNYNDLAGESHDAEWEEVAIPNPAAMLRVGENVIAVHALNVALASSDLSIDATLFIPAAGEGSEGQPTPGAQNSVYAENAPPQMRQVAHLIDQPTEVQNNYVSVKVTDPDGVQDVTLLYQAVVPGQYIPAHFPLSHGELLASPFNPPPPNPAFEDPANWFPLSMRDDGLGGDAVAGDSIYTTMVSRMDNRTLIRYRLEATDTLGASVRVPYGDDPSLNFAYFVYNGVPDYYAQTSITGQPTVHTAEDLTSMSVYFLITREEDITEAIAANSGLQIPQGTQARFIENWEGTVVHEGEVYDHVTYRLRGANGRYQVPASNPSTVAGKRHWRFKFNRGRLLQAYDRFGNPFPTKWKILNTGRMFGNRLDGNWGLNDQVNDVIWNAYSVPAAYGFSFHWRVVDGDVEAPAGSQGQYLGDFWGIARAFENYDVRFLDAHDLPKGNLYKLVNQTHNGLEQLRYQAPYAVDDGSDHDNIENNLRPSRSDAWLHGYVNYEEWYRYHALAQAFRHYDYWPEANKNAAWYFEPDYGPENSYFGRMWTLPFDADATWGPTWNAGRDRPYEAIYGSPGKPEFQKAYRNHIREVRDLLWQRDQLELVIRQTAAFIYPLQNADIDRWRNAPAEAGRQYFSGSRERTLDAKAADMIRFAFEGGSWPGGSVGAGGRAAFLDSFADNPDRGQLPNKPSVAYTGPAGYPIDMLTFQSSAFSDPQGAGTFKAMEWRIAEISDIPNPGAVPIADPIWRQEPVKLELEAVWTSGEITPFDPDITFPIRVMKVGRKYRVRVRMLDTTDRWSHWSAPFEFTSGMPATPVPHLDDLRITEIMYHPMDSAQFEFIELQNVGVASLNLENVWFSKGLDFDFAASAITSCAPGEIMVVARDLDSFRQRYDTAGMQIAGEYSGRLDNDFDRIVLTYAGNLDILDFTYMDTWYPETDGLGFSLNIADVKAARESWNDPANWFPSSVLGGTPGQEDTGGSSGGFLHPGDVNLDGGIDISDAVGLLLLLFHSDGLPTPCDGASVTEGGNVGLLDYNGDAAVNLADAVYLLSYLFREGPAHTLGTNCRRLEGCPTACSGLRGP